MSTSNISRLVIFVPLSEIETDKPLVLNIDGKEALRDKLDGYSSLVCECTDKGTWVVKKAKGPRRRLSTPEK